MPHSESTVLLRIARLVFDEAVLSSVVHPTIADLQEELRAAGSSRRRRLTARWRGYRAFWTLVLLAPVAFDDGAVRPRETVPLLDMVGRAAVATVVAIVVITLWLEAGLLILASAIAGYVLTALVVHTWHSRRPVRVAVPHDTPLPEINLAAIPVRADMGGVLYALGTAFEDKGWLRVRLSSGRILPLRAVAVTDNLLEILGMEPRWADPDPAAAWVSHAVATTRSGGALQPGRSAPILPEGLLRVESVLPRAFLLPDADRTMPVDALVLRPDGYVMTKDGPSTRTPGLVARTRPGVTPAMLEAALSATMPAGRQVRVAPLSAALTARLRGLAMGALLASGLIVLVCWTNVFNIALTRGLFRGPELATRTVLGATPGRLVGLLLTEGLRVAALGGAIALAVAWLTLSAAVVVLPPQFATLGVPSVTTRVAFFVVAAALVAGVSWGVASILAWRIGMRHEGRRIASPDGRAIGVVRFAVVAGQLGAASVLLAGAALLGHSYWNLMRIDAGMDERTQTWTVAHDPNLPPALRPEVVERSLAALRRAEGVQAAGASFGGFLDGRSGRRGIRIEGRPALDSRFPGLDRHLPDWTLVAGDYFEAMRLEFLAGGPPAPGQRGAVVINESMARQYFGGRLPIGEVMYSDADDPMISIVGVVRDVRNRGLSVPPGPAMYGISDASGRGSLTLTTYVLRVADPARAVGLERIVQRIDPMAVVMDAGAVRERLDRSIRERTFATLVVGLLAFASILVTASGLAGIVAYSVVKRTRELAIRLALGATGPGVTRLVMRDTLAAGTCGVAGGVVASVWLSRALESLLYGLRPADPTTLLLTAVSLLGIVLGAALLPAIRAARIAPATALRIE